MKIIYNPSHKSFNPQVEYNEGIRKRHRDQPDRIENLVNILKHRYLVLNAKGGINSVVERVHSPEYINFLRRISSKEDLFSSDFNRDSDGNQMTPYSTSAVRSAFRNTNAVIQGANLSMDGDNTFILTRPPGHHAGYDYSMGICYLNNAVIAAKVIQEEGFRVGILDIDLHHANGTQELAIMHRIPFASLHESPEENQSYIRDTGHTQNKHKNVLNIPLLNGTNDEVYLEELERALDFLSPNDFLVISAGFDISYHDKHSRLSLSDDIFERIGDRVAKFPSKKTVVLEGGYYDPNMMSGDISNFIEPISGVSFRTPQYISVIYHSESGNTEKMAELITQGVQEVENINAKAMRIDEIDLKYIRKSNALIIGSPTYYGGMSWQMKKFLDTFEKYGISLEGKLGSVFSTANWMGGGSEIALQSMHEAMFCYGMLVYSGGVHRGLPYNHLGAVSQRKPKRYHAKKSVKFGRDIALKSLELFSKL